jgi:hypothetical protein
MNRFSSSDILSKCNLLTVAERNEFVLLKSAFKSIVKEILYLLIVDVVGRVE